MSNADDSISKDRRDAWLRQSDGELLADCAVDAYRASGPGGQKRNKTSSAIRLRHRPSGLMVISEEDRSQHANKRRAVRRLRVAIAVRVRATVGPGAAPPADVQALIAPDGRIRIAESNPDFPRFVAFVLDALAARGGAMSEVADAMGTTGSQLVRLLLRDGEAWATANAIRTNAGLKPLRAS